MKRTYRFLAPLVFALPLAGPACSQTPVIVPVRSMERPRDVDFLCLLEKPDGTAEGAPLEKCRISPPPATPDPAVRLDRPSVEKENYHLHAVVTQSKRGELAVVDLGRGPRVSEFGMVKVDPRIPGFTFLPVGAVPTDVATDPGGKAVYVASGREARIDIIPAALVRGPIDSEASSGGPRPWPFIQFGADEGAPTRLAIVREGATGAPSDAIDGRLYALMPEAKGGPKIVVFDITTTPLAPVRLGAIALTIPEATPLPVPPLDCSNAPGTAAPHVPGLPWWNAYDKCFFVTTPPPAPPTVATTAPTMHLAGIAVAGGMLYAADDAAPFVHVFDIKNGNGVEVHRIAVGSHISTVAVSEPVPDEATLANVPALETCAAKNWFGDGLVHNEDPVVALRLKGRCRAHRYLYAVDLDDATNGDGSIAVVDIPTTLTRDATGTVVSDAIDLPSAELATPLACDSPALPFSRVSLGTLGIGGLNGVPARAVTFVNYDPPSPGFAVGAGTVGAGIKGVHCRPWGKQGCAAGDDHCVEYSAVDPLKAPGDAEAGLDDARRNAGASWRTGVDPKRLRGTFAFVALDNGAVVVVDVDDLDGTCRGPNKDTTSKPFPLDSATSLGISTGEYLNRVTKRHHPRSTRFFNADNLPAVGNPVFSTGFTAASSTQPGAPPHFVPLDEAKTPVLPAPDNVYALGTAVAANETWSVTFEGAIPGFDKSGTAGSFSPDGTQLLDPSAAFCRRGVQGDDSAHDLIQVMEDVCAADVCCAGGACTNGQKQHDDCAAAFGAPADNPLPKTRSLVIGTAFDDHVTIDQHFEQVALTAPPVAGPHPLMKVCFPGLSRYNVRVHDQWIVVGSSTGYLHRRKVSADPKTPGLCVADTSKPMIINARFKELSRDEKDFTDCKIFRNPSWRFMIQQGSADSVQGMSFTFNARFAFLPLALTIGSLPTSIKSLAYVRDGVDLLDWSMIGVVDAIDRGLSVVSVDDLTNSKVVN